MVNTIMLTDADTFCHDAQQTHAHVVPNIMLHDAYPLQNACKQVPSSRMGAAAAGLDVFVARKCNRVKHPRLIGRRTYMHSCMQGHVSLTTATQAPLLTCCCARV